jgi:hypothetical protein
MMLLCLKEFQNVSTFLQFSKRLEDLKWKIERQLLIDRIKIHEDNALFLELKKRYIAQKLSIFMLTTRRYENHYGVSFCIRKSNAV